MKAVKTLLLVGVALMLADFAVAQTWTQTSAASNNWSGVASSADGSRLVAVASRDGIYISTNAGLTWTETTAPNNYLWQAVASSADGTTLAAASVGIGTCVIYVSTNSGGDWKSASVPQKNWTSVALSADGSKIVALAGDFSFNPPTTVYTSTDFGTTWTLQTNGPVTYFWTTIASSSDGIRLTTFASNIILVSTNSGVNWMQASNPVASWGAVIPPCKEITCSTDGTRLAAIINSYIYISTNLGFSWTKTSAPANGSWSSIASSADGSKLIASSQTYSGPIYVSSDFGLTWNSNNVSSRWYAVAMSADGNKVVAVATPGGIWTGQTTPSPKLNLTPSPTNVTLAWTVPSTNFGLQQSADLTSWADVTNPPVLNLTNLQNQVTLAPSNSSRFYRLKTP